MIRNNKRHDRAKSRKKPYDRPTAKKSTGFFSSIRRLFSSSVPTSSPVKTNNSNSSSGNSNTVKANANKTIDYSSFATFSNISAQNNANPNETLTEFFKSKGDEPLTDMEVEGVLSLINKAHAQNNSMLDSGSKSFAGNGKVGGFNAPRFNTTTTNATIGDITSGLNTSNNSMLANNTTTVLRPRNLKTPVKVDTPTYIPKISTIKRRRQNINNISALGNHVPQSTRRRIVTFSSLPSPFRNRISSPLQAYIKSKEQEKKRVAENRNITLLASNEHQKSDDLCLTSREYTGGAIDLSVLDNDGDDDISMATNGTLGVSNGQLSKTASRVLSMLNGKPLKEDGPKKQPVKVIEKSTNKPIEKKNINELPTKKVSNGTQGKLSFGKFTEKNSSTGGDFNFSFPKAVATVVKDSTVTDKKEKSDSSSSFKFNIQKTTTTSTLPILTGSKPAATEASFPTLFSKQSGNATANKQTDVMILDDDDDIEIIDGPSAPAAPKVDGSVKTTVNSTIKPKEVFASAANTKTSQLPFLPKKPDFISSHKRTSSTLDGNLLGKSNSSPITVSSGNGLSTTSDSKKPLNTSFQLKPTIGEVSGSKPTIIPSFQTNTTKPESNAVETIKKFEFPDVTDTNLNYKSVLDRESSTGLSTKPSLKQNFELPQKPTKPESTKLTTDSIVSTKPLFNIPTLQSGINGSKDNVSMDIDVEEIDQVVRSSHQEPEAEMDVGTEAEKVDKANDTGSEFSGGFTFPNAASLVGIDPELIKQVENADFHLYDSQFQF
ncbi:unnamed protein product [Ambrosiozyma monospora]|uniref:Unnamed protein product n=1 Tax=Ambrosiozyma monospora TaxID=43982 RepID=A0A9W7DDH4_AMBMO|nr:unnamed protein product [Ambrosiozyma monospora]